MGAIRNKRSAEDPVLRAISACIAKHASPGDAVAVGYSGGLDSTVLLHAAHLLVRSADISLSAIHVHHGLSQWADAWADHCGRTCGELGVPLTVARVSVDIRQGEGVEAAARRERHLVLASYSANWILLGHHADDQAETTLHNLLRGAGVRGAAAMPACRGKLLRPLLTLSRSILIEYANSQGMQWIEDDSNADCRFTRNYLRTEIFPRIHARFPQAAKNLAAAASRFGDASSLLDDLALIDLAGQPAAFPLSLDLLQGLPEPRARNLLRSLLTRHGVQAPDEARLIEFVRQLRTARTDRRPRLDLAAYRLWSEKGWIRFQALD